MREESLGVAVTDLNRSSALYEKLGFAKGRDDEEANVKGCMMTCGSAVVFLFQTTQITPQAVQCKPPLAQNPSGLNYLSFLVEDVNRLYAELKAKGIAFLGEPADQDWGARLVGCRDPDGTHLPLLQARSIGASSP